MTPMEVSVAEQDRNIVKKGGVAKSDADLEDVTRDTYGFTETSDAEQTESGEEEARRRAHDVLDTAVPDDEADRLGRKD
jgi:hypothetical protein